MISNVFAKRVIRYLLDCKNEKLPKEMMFAFELNIIMFDLESKKRYNIFGKGYNTWKGDVCR